MDDFMEWGYDPSYTIDGYRRQYDDEHNNEPIDTDDWADGDFDSDF